MQQEHDDSELPAALIEDLARLDKSLAVMTPAVDRHLAEAARAHFGARPERRRMTPGRWALVGSLAASLLVAVVLWRTESGVDPSLLANDIDGSGVVDILDAFALARMAGEDRTPAAQERIDSLAMSIVALNAASGRS